MSELYCKIINGFEVEFDCSKKERKSLEDKLNLVSLGNGKDICPIACNDTGCGLPKLKVRHYDNVRKDKFKEGGIEIESNYTGLIVNNCCSVYHDVGEDALLFSFPEKQLAVRMVYPHLSAKNDVQSYSNPLEDLKRSYARGEIDKEEYLELSQKIEKEKQQRLKEMLSNEKKNLVSDAALKLGRGEITVAEFQQRTFGDLPGFKDFYKP